MVDLSEQLYFQYLELSRNQTVVFQDTLKHSNENS